LFVFKSRGEVLPSSTLLPEHLSTRSAPQHLCSTYQHFWVLGASTYPVAILTLREEVDGFFKI
jgi:hypothetical protein